MLNVLGKIRRQSTMKLDPAVVQLLGLEDAATSVSSAGGGGCSSASTSKIVSKLRDGTQKTFFMKTGSGHDAKVMFEGVCTMKLRVVVSSCRRVVESNNTLTTRCRRRRVSQGNPPRRAFPVSPVVWLAAPDVFPRDRLSSSYLTVGSKVVQSTVARSEACQTTHHTCTSA
jgi:hypothetical protein